MDRSKWKTPWWKGKGADEIMADYGVEPEVVTPELKPKPAKTVTYKRPSMSVETKRYLQENLKMDKCRYCHAVEDLTMDHKIPLSQGGTHDLKNMQCLCRRCNQMKSSMTDKEVLAFWNWHVLVLMERDARKRGIWIK